MVWIGMGFAFFMISLLILIPFAVYKFTKREKHEVSDDIDPELRKKIDIYNNCIFGGILMLCFSGGSFYSGELILPKNGGTDLNPNNDPGIQTFFVLMLLYAGVGQLIYGVWGRIKVKNA